MQRRSFIKGATTSTLLSGLPASSLSRVALTLSQTSDAPVPAQQASDTPGAQPGLYYAPKGGRVGDVIPFHDGERFRIFHLYHADGQGGETTWQQVSTTDFVHWTQHGTMLPRGTLQEQDPSVATGSVIRDAKGLYHAFYTGYNSPKRKTQPEQGVMHATSDDLLHWTKHHEDTFYAPVPQFEKDDWRDPFVFWNEERQQYWMLIAARLRSGPSRRRGCTALATSTDLKQWQVRDPFWAPGLFYTHECPDLFRIGDWWYLIFSEFSKSNQTRYRMSRNLEGPWLIPADDVFDTRAFYAGKTAFNGTQRYLFGWNPRRRKGDDGEGFEWGGTLVVHALHQQPNGELTVDIPRSISDAFSTKAAVTPVSALGPSHSADERIEVNGRGTYALVTLGVAPATCRLTGALEFAPGTASFGLAFRLQGDLDTGHFLRFEPSRQRMVLDRWPRPGDIPFQPGFERPVALHPGSPLPIDIVLSEGLIEIYVAGKVAMSARMYQPAEGQLGVFAEDGSMVLHRLQVSSMMKPA